jgi:transcriptional regulator with XRE-family HTH domain
MVGVDPVAGLRELRELAGLSLRDVARRAGTSAATIHRYESGWARFEVFTLQKLARALDCELQIRFVPTPPPRKRSRTKAARDLARLFWDRPLHPEDLERHPAWVVARVLEYGQLEDVRALVGLLGRDRFFDVLAGVHLAEPKGRRLWAGLLKLEGRRCTRRFSREAADGCWTNWRRPATTG